MNTAKARVTIRLCLALAVWATAPGASAGNYEVLILNGDARNQEIPILTKFAKVGNHSFTFEEVKIEGGSFDGNLRGAQILYFPWNGPGHDGNYFMKGAEKTVLDWVNNGGVVYMHAFDDNYRDQNGKQIGGWMPIDEHPVVVQNTGDSEVEITPDGEKSGLFSKPNKVDMNAVTLDDNFSALDKSWVILATRKDNGQPAACWLPYGKGGYLEVCADTRDAGLAAKATSLMENALQFLADKTESGLAVRLTGGAATTWGALKAR